MLDSIQTLFDSFPEGMLQLRRGVVLAANAMARRYLPQLAEGAPAPDYLPLPAEGCAGAGEFSSGTEVYTYSCTAAGGEAALLFRPAPQAALTGRQLEGALYQLRTLFGELLIEVGPAAGKEGGAVPAGPFGKTFHRLFRLLDNMEYLQGAEQTRFRLVTMDLAGLCGQVERLAGPLLKEAGVALSYQGEEGGLLIPGDPELLQRLLLELISNAARAAQAGEVRLTLRRQGGRAVFSVSHSGPGADEEQLAALFRPGVGEEIPRPDQGAGLGLSIARHIVSLHRGSMMIEWGRSAPGAVVSLPTGPLDGRVSFRAPVFQQDAGLDPVLVELSDILPASVFELEGLD